MKMTLPAALAIAAMLATVAPAAIAGGIADEAAALLRSGAKLAG
jgi:hypothetical protein